MGGMPNDETVQIGQIGAQQPFGRLIRDAAGGELSAVHDPRRYGADGAKPATAAAIASRTKLRTAGILSIGRVGSTSAGLRDGARPLPSFANAERPAPPASTNWRSELLIVRSAGRRGLIAERQSFRADAAESENDAWFQAEASCA